jgi:hypothetical protein
MASGLRGEREFRPFAAQKHPIREFDFAYPYSKFSCEPKTPRGLRFFRHGARGKRRSRQCFYRSIF